MPDIAFLGDGENVFITVYNSALPVDKQDTDAFSIKIGETDRKFRMIFTVTDFVPFVEDTYDIELCFKGIAKLTSNKLTYWISPSSKSTYN
jgi:hypothetical protein